jgi:hypothetical protein
MSWQFGWVAPEATVLIAETVLVSTVCVHGMAGVLDPHVLQRRTRVSVGITISAVECMPEGRGDDASMHTSTWLCKLCSAGSAGRLDTSRSDQYQLHLCVRVLTLRAAVLLSQDRRPLPSCSRCKPAGQWCSASYLCDTTLSAAMTVPESIFTAPWQDDSAGSHSANGGH